jgi:hypothetical protein
MQHSLNVLTTAIGISSAFSIMLSDASAAQAGACRSTDTVAGVDFGNCQTLQILGSNQPSIEQFESKMASILSMEVAQYKSDFAATYAQQIGNGELIAVRYEQRQTNFVAFSKDTRCLKDDRLALQLGCSIEVGATHPLVALR